MAGAVRDLFTTFESFMTDKTARARRTADSADQYTAADIEVLEGLEPVRRRPGMYIGGTDSAGYHHLLWEVVDNCVDEAMNGHATRIEVELDADLKGATVADNGRGIPIDKHPKFKVPALELILTNAPDGCGYPEGSVVRLLRKINGRRDGSRAYVDYAAAHIKTEVQMEQGRLHPCGFRKIAADGSRVNIVKHIDDSATSGTPEELDKLAVDLGKGMSLRCTGALTAHGRLADQDWQNFLSRERKRDGATLIKRPKQKFVDECCVVLGLVPGEFKVAELPSSKELQRLEGPELDKIEYGKFRTVMGKLTFIQEDLVAGQYTWQELSKEVCTPTEASMARLKHFIRFLFGHRETVQLQKIVKSEKIIRVKVDSNFAGENNNRRSKDCVHAFVHGALVSNSVKDQAFLAQSSCEAELAGSHRGAIVGIFLQNMWEEMFDEKLDIVIETDSSAARCVAMRQGIGRIRHLEVRQIYMQQLVKSERLVVKKLPGIDNTADLGTKAVTAATFYHLIELVGLRKFTGDTLEVIQPWRAKRASKGMDYSSVAAMLVTLVSALQPREVASSESHAVDLLVGISGASSEPHAVDLLVGVAEKFEEASRVLDIASCNWILVSLLVLAVLGSIALGVMTTLGVQFAYKVYDSMVQKEIDNEIDKHKEIEKKNKIDVRAVTSTRSDPMDLVVGSTQRGVASTDPHVVDLVVGASYKTIRIVDKRLQGGFVSRGGACIHLDEQCIIRHSNLGDKSIRNFRFWCSKCVPPSFY